MEMGERMNEEFFVITCDEEVENCCRRLDELLISFRQPLYIRLSVSKAMFERTLGSIVPRLQFLNAGVISGLNVINDDYQVIDEDDFSLEQEIHRLEDGMKDPKNYYREEMQKVTDPSPSKS